MMDVILITGCGGDIALSLAKILKIEKIGGKLIGCDIHDKHPGMFVYDRCEIVPRADTPGYLKHMSKMVKELGITIVIPMSEAEIRYYHSHKITHLNDVPIMFSANDEALKIGLDKLATSRFLEKNGMPFPKTRLVSDGPVSMPCIHKDRFGSGSKKIALVQEDELPSISLKKPDFIFQEYLLPDDEEYTCGLFRSTDTRCIIFRRTMNAGYTSYGEVVDHPDIIHLLNKLAKAINLKGSINVQLRLTEKGPMIFEINPRFSSTVLFRHMSGFKDFIWRLYDFCGESIPDYKAPPPGVKIYKAYQEFVLSGKEVQTVDGEGNVRNFKVSK